LEKVKVPKPKTTIKQSKLVQGIVAGKTKRQAAADAGYSGSPETLSVTASEVLKKPNVQEALQAELARQGITLEQIIAPVAKALKAKVRVKTIDEDGRYEIGEADDIEMQLKGHDRAVRLVLPRQQDGVTTNYNFINVAGKDKDEFGI
jgi:phage terminase small subunit